MSAGSPWVPRDGSPASCPGCSLAPPPPVWPQRETEPGAGAARRPGDPQRTPPAACASRRTSCPQRAHAARVPGPPGPLPLQAAGPQLSPLAVSTRRGPGASRCRRGTSCWGSGRPRTGRPSAGTPASAARSSGPRCGCCGRAQGPAAPGTRGPSAGNAWPLPGRRAPAGAGGRSEVPAPVGGNHSAGVLGTSP